jgi:predicted DNA binding CopG/RHH family protein
MPKKSTAELAGSWYASQEGRRQTQREFERALKQGAVPRSAGSTIPPTHAKLLAELAEKAKENVTKAISIRITVADLEQAQTIAAKEGIGYQTVLKRAIRAGLKKVS